MAILQLAVLLVCIFIGARRMFMNNNMDMIKYTPGDVMVSYPGFCRCLIPTCAYCNCGRAGNRESYRFNPFCWN